MSVMPNEDIHPELRRAARFIPRFTIQPWALPLVRTLTDLRKPSNTGVEVLTLPSGAGVRLHRPATAAGPTPALLWIHGGGYLFGTAAQDDDVCRQYVQRLGITVAAVDYRLAPEHPYPIPLEDCYSVLTWLARLPGIDPNRIRQKLANIDPEGNWRFDDDRQLIQRIFDWGVSTRDGASQLSGRGVGLEAVKEEVKKLGGSIKVTSEIYVGTTFEMIIPLPHMKDYQLSSKVA